MYEGGGTAMKVNTQSSYSNDGDLRFLRLHNFLFEGLRTRWVIIFALTSIHPSPVLNLYAVREKQTVVGPHSH